MKYDAGALSKYRNMSPIFRYLSNNPPISSVWPKKWKDELGIFLATPGISWQWVQDNFNLPSWRLHHVFHATKDKHHLAQENVLTATEENAIMYMRHRPYAGLIPFWAKPFIMDDIKAGLSFKQLAEKWNISQDTVGRLKHDKSGNLFHSSREHQRWRNMGR